MGLRSQHKNQIVSDPNSMSNGTPYLGIYQSLPHPTLVLDTHSSSLKNIKEWIVGIEKLYKCHYLGPSLCLANKNNRTCHKQCNPTHINHTPKLVLPTMQDTLA
jgi:hypothetical protein